MKKTLIAPRRDLKLELLEKKKSTPRSLNAQSFSLQKNLSAHLQKQQKHTHHHYQGKYRNKNINVLTAPLIVSLSTLTTLDLSYNQLNDGQIQLVMNTCSKLVTLCIQGNLYTIIPASIWKLKELIHFKHDWLKINNGKEQSFEPEQHLLKIKRIVQKPELVVKINRVVGLDFQVYCKQIVHISLDHAIVQKIQKCCCSSHAKEVMLRAIKQVQLHLVKQRGKVKPIMQKQQYVTANTGLCGFNEGIREREPKATIFRKKQSQNSHRGRDLSDMETDCGSNKIKIQDIKDISGRESPPNIIDKQIPYSDPSHPLHQLFAHFDKNPKSPSEIDSLLLRGYNPNQYDTHGLSPYHVCAIQNQKTGFQYLLEISANNPGFFDLQMPSGREGRNILHFCVFLKNYDFTKKLIQFGFPIEQRDSNGARIVHLVDQNYQFLLLLRKMFKKMLQFCRDHDPQAIPLQNSKKYVKHPQRLKQQTKIRQMLIKNQKLLNMYQEATRFIGDEQRKY